MRHWIYLAWASLQHRRSSTLIVLVMVALCSGILASAERVFSAAKSSFYSSVSGTDLIVGARTNDINLLLYSVFHIGNARNNVSWQSLRTLAEHKAVKWWVPISLGDSYRNHRVIGTQADFFEHFRYGDQIPLQFTQGRAFKLGAEVVVGADVMAKQTLSIGDEIVLTHGTADVDSARHQQLTFEVVGILAPTGTPLDRSVLTDLTGLDLVHMPAETAVDIADNAEALAKLTPGSVTAAMIGLNSRLDAFALQRTINDFPEEALTAVLPTATLASLWNLLGSVETAIQFLGGCLVVVSVLAVLAVFISSLRERRREFAVLRANGLGRVGLIMIVQLEMLLINTAAACIGVFASFALLSLFAEPLSSLTGIRLQQMQLSMFDLQLVVGVSILSILVALVPAISAYRGHLNQGLTPQ